MADQHFLSSTPVDVAIKALQRQVDQLKRIVNPGNEDQVAMDDSSELKEEIKELRTQNAKQEYRIKMLLRALEERDNK